MAWLQRYEKKGCKTKTDVNFRTIMDNCRIHIPPGIIGQYYTHIARPVDAFQKHVNGAKAWDVKIEEDRSTAQLRLTLTHIAAAPIVIVWKDEEKQLSIAKVKATVNVWKTINGTHLGKIVVVKEEIKKKLKTRIQDVEKEVASVAQNQLSPAVKQKLTKEIGEIIAALDKAVQDGKQINGAHAQWYGEGPRKGIDPVLQLNALQSNDLGPADQTFCSTAVMEISKAAGEVLQTFKTDIEAAAQTLKVRLKNLESQITKDAAVALKDVRRSLESEIKRLGNYTEKSLAGIKYDQVEKLVYELNSGQASNVTSNRTLATGMIAANQNKTLILIRTVEDLEKEDRRLRKTVPPAFVTDPEIVKMLAFLTALKGAHNKRIDAAKATLKVCSDLLTARLGTTAAHS